MQISSFSRMLSYRNSGHTASLLKLVLPYAKDEGQDEFNSFYAKLAECYASVAERLAEGYENALPPTVISVDFEILNQIPPGRFFEKRRETLVFIRRRHRIRRAGEEVRGEFFDCFDFADRIFVK